MKITTFVILFISLFGLQNTAFAEKDVRFLGFKGPKVCIEVLKEGCPELKDYAATYATLTPSKKRELLDFLWVYVPVKCDKAQSNYLQCDAVINSCRGVLEHTHFWEPKPDCVEELNDIYGKDWNK